MMTILFNQQALQCDSPQSLADFLKHYHPLYHHSGYAVALNRQFVPQNTYAQIQLKEGDRIDVVSPMQGG